MLLGAHESIAGGLHNAFEPAEEDGCEVLQIFTKNASQWQARPISPDEVDAFRTARSGSSIRFIAVHDSYLINLAQPDQGKWARAVSAFRDEMDRATLLGCDHLIFHPGAHLNSGEDRGLARIAEALDRCLEGYDGSDILIETTAGQGTVLGYRFEQVASIIDMVEFKDRVGVAYDTCHTFTAGYDIRSPDAYGETFDMFNATVGLDRLRAFHLNDSKKEFGSRKDRHEQIGKGEIGLEAFRMLVNDERFTEIPGYLETPPLEDGARGYRENLDLLRSLIEDRGRT
jgi:deoxyribonuclease-4